MTDPQTDAVSRGWDPADGLGSLKTPLFHTSTFVFESAEAAERLFAIVYGGEKPGPDEDVGFIYTRMDHPNLVITEDKLASWDGAEGALLFSSGTAAIFTTFLTHIRPGDLILHGAPLYGGTNTLLQKVMVPLGFEVESFGPETSHDEIESMIGGRRLGALYLETPANPSNDVFDIALASRVAQGAATSEQRPVVIVDNTFLGPFAQRPLDHGGDLVVYSATKFFGGHDDLTAGVVTGSGALIEPMKTMRYRIGTTADPHAAWMVGRSLETYSMRMERQTANAHHVSEFLLGHPKVERVRYLGAVDDDDRRVVELAKRQWTSGGSMICFDVAGGKEAAFRFLNAMRLVANATSLGGTRSIACHPWTTTHSNVDLAMRRRMGIAESMIRLSVGVEATEDIIADLDQALTQV
jgi:methionine-gamma-lyase